MTVDTDPSQYVIPMMQLFRLEKVRMADVSIYMGTDPSQYIILYMDSSQYVILC